MRGGTARVGSVAPLRLYVEVYPSGAASPTDATVTTPLPALDVVTAAELSVLRAGTLVAETWTATILSKTASKLVLVHPYEATDLVAVESLTVTPILTTPDGDVPCVPFNLTVER